ncbi:MAG: hypothetical protein ABTQ26_12250 [Azonexus sp.]
MSATFRAANRAARAIRGTTGERRREAISAFLRAAMVALLLGGRACP